MTPIEHKQLLRDVREWVGLQEKVRTAPMHVPVRAYGSGGEMVEVEAPPALDELRLQLTDVEDRLGNFSGVTLLRFIHANQHVIRF